MNDSRPPLTMTTIGAKPNDHAFGLMHWTFNFTEMTYQKECTFGDKLAVLDLVQESLRHRNWVRIAVRWAGDLKQERCFFLRDDGSMEATQADREPILEATARVESIIIGFGPSRTTADNIRKTGVATFTAVASIRFQA